VAIKHFVCIVTLLTCMHAFASDPSPLIREEHKVLVDGVEEVWRLEWVNPPSPVCSPDEPDVWPTCPCEGFAFGESGNLVLVRKRPGQEEERFALNQLFDEELDAPGKSGQAVLRRWDVDQKDRDEANSPGFAARVRARSIATVMHFGDYDHDGRATEFLVQVGTLPCGKKMSVVVGISRATPQLHVFRSAEHPEIPLVLQSGQWEALLKAKAPVKVRDWACGDHGAETETELELSADAGNIHATRTEFECKEDGSRGRRLDTEQY
jgi:hypothetical protein